MQRYQIAREIKNAEFCTLKKSLCKCYCFDFKLNLALNYHLLNQLAFFFFTYVFYSVEGEE